MQGSKSDSFVKTQKQHKRFDDGTGKRRDSRQGRGNGHFQVRDKRQDN